jgi:hypothetical protein
MNHQSLIIFFNYNEPTPARIREKYKNVVDFGTYNQLNWENIIYAIINCKANEAIIIPGEYGRMLLEVKDHSLKGCKKPWLIHWLYAPDVMLNTTGMTVSKSSQFSLEEAVKKAKWDYNVPHRGFGVIDPRTHAEILWPFLYLVEGWKLAELGRDLIKITSGDGVDRTGLVPSISKIDHYTATLRNVSDDPSTLIQLYGDCTCLWTHYGLRRREKRYEGGERTMCRHCIALYRYLEESDKSKKILPKPTGIMNPWLSLKERTIVGDGKITRTQMNALLGMIAAYMKEIGLSPWD